MLRCLLAIVLALAPSIMHVCIGGCADETTTFWVETATIAAAGDSGGDCPLHRESPPPSRHTPTRHACDHALAAKSLDDATAAAPGMGASRLFRSSPAAGEHLPAMGLGLRGALHASGVTDHSPQLGVGPTRHRALRI